MQYCTLERTFSPQNNAIISFQSQKNHNEKYIPQQQITLILTNNLLSLYQPTSPIQKLIPKDTQKLITTHILLIKDSIYLCRPFLIIQTQYVSVKQRKPWQSVNKDSVQRKRVDLGEKKCLQWNISLRKEGVQAGCICYLQVKWIIGIESNIIEAIPSMKADGEMSPPQRSYPDHRSLEITAKNKVLVTNFPNSAPPKEIIPTVPGSLTSSIARESVATSLTAITKIHPKRINAAEY